MTPLIWRAERTDGTTAASEGIEGWRDVLTHADVTEAGRLLRLSVGAITVELQPDERLQCVRRRCLAVNHDSPEPTRTILGIVRPDGCAVYLDVSDAGGAVLSSAFNR